MPSWGIHLVTANEIIKSINVIDKNSFLIGNFIPDEQGYVVKDISTIVPYDITHFAELQEIDKILDKLPNYNKFFYKYKSKLNNPLLLGYLVHLLTDYYWNRTTHFRYTIMDKNGNCLAIKTNDGRQIEADKEIRKNFKHNDFYIFENYLLEEYNKDIEFPEFNEEILKYLIELEETKYNESDINKIINYLKDKYTKIEKQDITKFKLFTLEQIKNDYKESINFILDFLKNNNIV